MKNKERLPIIDLFEALLLMAVMTALMCCDPFGVNRKIADFLRLNFPIFTKEPRLFFYAVVYTGSFLAKSAAVILIAILLLARKVGLDNNLAVRTPSSSSWRSLIIPFIIISAAIRAYYSDNPLVPNLPVHFVFSESMFFGSAIVVFSIVFVAPVTEEIIFRGYFFDVFKRSFGVRASVFIVAALFALAHGPQMNFDPVSLGIIFAMGVFFGVMRENTGSLVAPIVFHGIYNLINVVVGTLYYFILGY